MIKTIKEIYTKNLGNLTEPQLSFYEYCLENYELILTKTLNEIAKDYGVGMSFIYGFFKKIAIKNLKDYIFFLGFNLAERDAIKNTFKKQSLEFDPIEALKETILESNEANFLLIKQQQTKIKELISDLATHEKIFYLGLGYSKLASQDFLGFFDFINKDVFLINNVEKKYSDNLKKITNNSLVVIYSIRATNHTIVKWVKDIHWTYPGAKIYLITTNIQTTIAKYCDVVIEIDNILKRVDSLKLGVLLSPLTAFINFNNVIKTLYFVNDQSNLIQNNFLKDELDSWRDDKLKK